VSGFEQASRWVDRVWGDRRGYFFFAFGVGGRFDDRGKYMFEQWQERYGRWPDDRDRFLAEALERANRDDVYVAPYLRSNASRKKGNALPSDVIYADVDRLDPSLNGFESALIGPGGMVVESGQEDHLHVYAGLPDDLEPAELERLNRHLAHRLRADAGWAENKVLRLPGTWNHKGAALDFFGPWPVRIAAGERAPRDWTPDELRELLGPEPGDFRATAASPIAPSAPVAVPTSLFARLREDPRADRSAQSYSFVGACLKAGLSDAETLALALQHEPTRAKYGDRAGVEIERAIRKHREKPSAASGEPPTADTERFRPEPVDWPAVIAAGVPELEYLDEPYLPARKRIWGVGAAESGKSIWAAWKVARLTRSRLLVVYVSQENGLEEEARRFLRLGPDFERLRLYVDQGFDLALPSHRDVLLEISAGAALVVLDTLTACWSGDEDSNNDLAAFDRDVMKPLTVARASVLVLDHTGNPQPFARRRGVSAPRGASSKGQKTDFLLEFTATDDGSFKVERSKKRGTHGAHPQVYRVVDAADGTLELVETEATERSAELADRLVEAIKAGAPLATKQVRAIAYELGHGVEPTSAALELLKAEQPRRVTVAWEVIDTAGGRQRVKAWRPVDEDPTASQTELWEADE
jgi:hypothetical protein